MPRKKRIDKRRPTPPGLSIASLHFMATGGLIDDAEGIAMFGDGFSGMESLCELHPRTYGVAYRTHKDAIEAHSRALGQARSWASAQTFEGDQ